MTAILRLFVTGLYSGLSPKMPGTCGTFVAMLVGAGMVLGGCTTAAAFFVSGLLSTVLGIGAINALYARGFYDQEDPQEVVIDEWAGFFLAVALGCIQSGQVALIDLAVGFVLFRLFDILKPPPIRLLERFPRGWGVMVDDLGAGIYAGVVFLILRVVFKSS